jgi:CRISPR-associated RAMP protein (TIGR02581 family)
VTSSPANFDRLESRVRLTGTLQLVTALHLGAGKGVDGTDMPVLKDAEGFPFIPGASLKGVLRSTTESLLRALDQNRKGGLWACDPFVDDEAATDRACGVQSSGHKRADVDIGQHCAACRVFGSRVLASHVRISDALMPSEARQRRPPIELRDGVAIDRDRRVVHGGQKFDFEVVSPGATFALEVFVENPEPWALGLLMIGFDQISEGFSAVGGFTSRGLGRARLEWSEVRRCTAEQLLSGHGPETFCGDQMLAELTQWREALATKVKGSGRV